MRVLLVDDDPSWGGPIRRLLADCEVELAESQEEALRLIRAAGAPYDVAIVDLNLIDTPDHQGSDLLGAEVLELLLNHSPSTRRIAWTAWPPGAVRKLLDQYEVEELLIKGRVQLAEIRDLVHSPPLGARAGIPPEVEAKISGLRADLQRLWEAGGDELDKKIQGLEEEILFSGRVDGGENPEHALEALEARLAELRSQRAAFDEDCRRLAARLGSLRNAEDVARAAPEISELRNKFGSDRLGRSGSQNLGPDASDY